MSGTALRFDGLSRAPQTTLPRCAPHGNSPLMCSRITLTLPDPATLAALLGVPFEDPDEEASYKPRYNVAPTQPHWVVTEQTPHRIVLAQWGLGPRRLTN